MPLKEPESWTQLQSICLALIIVSGFAGALCALAAMYFEWPQELAGFAVILVVTLAQEFLPFLTSDLFYHLKSP
ncbi:hypothetical protein [Vibrio cholerae]|nr:hypothetical protein [Vibrio cholerae]MCD6645977.1 hypothetical protein [Vibrio cholerae]MCD6668615.1 hypothetical protein [Vibrio cholerae]MDQ4621921.1 hypothetical protein [Vibrio cholerae]MDQ4694981.1 hypothetical protein [Vibrio cholerae]MDY7587582.1 hypothetical protein [Vibrio cholerae]